MVNYGKRGEKMSNKPKVFVITPFNEDFLALYDELKRVFGAEYEFENAGDLDNQQNILKDIVVGIHNAQVIIADVTGLNANVFYELGLAHAMNKKVIIITQDIGELPFDIKSYRANEYSLQFNKLPVLIEKLKKLLGGAIDNTTQYGNPVSDYLPDYFSSAPTVTPVESSGITPIVEDSTREQDEGDKGYLDYISDIQEYAEKMTNEINTMSEEMQQNNAAITAATNEINRVKTQSGNVDATFVRNVCRKISSPTELFASQIKGHTEEISKHWNIIENSYLSLLDNQYDQTPQNLQEIKDSLAALKSMQGEIHDSNGKIEGFVTVLRGIIGVERKLNKAITSLIMELESYLRVTDTMSSSIDRIISKGNLVVEKLESK